jgi:hypothetical protein
VLDELRGCFRRFAPFDFSLAAPRRFAAEVLYLAPEPDTQLRRLISALAERYPETPPYGGQFSDPAPHLTVAQIASETRLDEVTRVFEQAAAGMLPIHAKASKVALMENRSGKWRVRATFELGIRSRIGGTAK